MITIKVKCPCGQNYAFDVTPVGGAMPHPVQCPICGADGTATANQTIARQSVAPPSPTPPDDQDLSVPASQEPPSTPRLPKGKLPIQWAIAGLVGVVLAATAVVGVLLWSRYKPAEPNPTAAITGSEPADTPRTLEALNKWYAEPPEGQNAAMLYRPGFDALRVSAADQKSPNLPLIGKGRLPPAGTPLPLAMRSSISAFIQRNKEALPLLAAGEQCAGSRYPINLTHGAQTPLPHLAKVKQATQLVVLVGVSEACAGHTDAAADATLKALSLARSLEAEPLLISQLVRCACLTSASVGLEQILSQCRLPQAALDPLQQAWQKAEVLEAEGVHFTRAIVGERVVGLATLDMTPDQLRQLGSSVDENQARILKDLLAVKESIRKADRAYFEETYTQILTARKDTLPARLRVDDLVAGRVNQAKSKQFLFTHLFMPSQGTKKEAESLAHIRLAQAAVALERYRLANSDSYPDTLSSLVPKFLPAVPNGPFDGLPLLYRNRMDGYELSTPGAEAKSPVTFTVNPAASARGK